MKDQMITKALSLGVLFILLAVLIYPFFSSSISASKANSYCYTNTTGSCNYDTTINTTPLTSQQKSCGATEYGVGTDYCARILTYSNYGTALSGVLLVVFVVTMVSFAVVYLRKY